MDQNKINQLREQPISAQHLFINGCQVQAANNETLDVISPIDGNVISSIASAQSQDVDDAVNAARSSYDKGIWSQQSPAQRKKTLFAIADLIDRHALELAVLGVRDNGTELGMAIKGESGSSAATFRYYAESIDKVYGEIAPTADNVLGLIHREAIGVVGAIVPWNFPLMIASWKIAPALAAGNSVVLKPSENASLSVLRLAQLCQQAGLPDGVLNVVTGLGHIAGKAMAMHMDIDVLAFTGSGPVGRALMHDAADSNMKKVYLELGGKSPNIVFADVEDLDNAAKVSAMGIFRNSGQVCIAGSRILVERSIHQAFVEKLKNIAEQMTIGDPLDLASNIGCVANQMQLQRNLAVVNHAREQGAKLVSGGLQLHQQSGGYYMQPTVFDEVTPNMDLANQEAFGPIVAVIPFDTEAEAIAIANSTEFGLAAAIWTANLSRAHRLVKAVKAGVVHVNTYGGADNTVPLGGHKQSGNGVDKSLHAIEKYTELKTAWIQL